jgi:Protein of unknown function (DUF2442)
MTPPAIKAFRATDDRLIFTLDHGREVSLPVSMSTRLTNATPMERDHWTISSRGTSVHWPDIDEDIAIWEVLGIAEDVYLRSLGEAPVG